MKTYWGSGGIAPRKISWVYRGCCVTFLNIRWLRAAVHPFLPLSSSLHHPTTYPLPHHSSRSPTNSSSNSTNSSRICRSSYAELLELISLLMYILYMLTELANFMTQMDIFISDRHQAWFHVGLALSWVSYTYQLMSKAADNDTYTFLSLITVYSIWHMHHTTRYGLATMTGDVNTLLNVTTIPHRDKNVST